jgi:hypothetical protein
LTIPKKDCRFQSIKRFIDHRSNKRIRSPVDSHLGAQGLKNIQEEEFIMYWTKINESTRRLLYTTAIVGLIAVALLLVAKFSPADVSAAPAAVMSPAATFPANAGTLGAIPDGTGAAGVCGADRNVTFTVAGMAAPLSNVEVSFTMTSHTWVGDIEAAVVSPGGTATHLCFSRTGATTAASFGDDSDLLGPYNFKDSAAGTHWWTAAAGVTAAVPVPSGDYRTVAAGPSAAPPALTTMTTTFAGLTTPQTNGTWTLRMRDCAGGDTGSVSAATLTLTGGVAPTGQNMIDFDGNGRTDFSVVRNTGGGPTGQVTWFNQLNGGAGTHSITPFGIATDFFVPGNYDADNITDIAVWRPGAPGASGWFILQSATSTVRSEIFGQSGDDPTVVGDYNGDGLDDLAVYRAGAASGDKSFWYWRQAVAGPVFAVQWGQNGDFVAPGDYDGNGSNDFVIQRNNGGGQAAFWTRLSTGATSLTVFGTPTDVVVPGDYDGDGKTDIATIRGSGGQINWFVLPSGGGAFTTSVFGLSASDFPAQGDYDGDGKTDVAVWRPNADPTQCFFFTLGSTAGFAQVEWGQNGDYPIANYNSH